jgi:hypothetical protein
MTMSTDDLKVVDAKASQTSQPGGVEAVASDTVTVTVTVTDNLFRHEIQKKPRPSPLSARTITPTLFNF